MKRYFLLAVTLLGAAFAIAAPARGSDACSPRAVLTEAKVSASDGTKFAMKSYFHTRHSAALRRIQDDTVTIALEGPFVWSGDGAKQKRAEDALRSFVLGHQFHALMLHFDKIVDDVRPSDEISYDGKMRTGLVGNWPYGGTAQLILEKPAGRAEALKLTLVDFPEIVVTFHDWRRLGGRTLPFELRIFDESRTFIYSYTDILIEERSPLWFFEEVGAADLDGVQIYRLHRRLLAAHCNGDAESISAAAAPHHININKGRLSHVSPVELRSMFEEVFNRLSYSEYHDLVAPIVEVSAAADVGWLAATVRPTGTVMKTNETFDDEWSWLMTVRKIDGQWKFSGMSASRSE